ncbi:MAG TPA: hypothetical protein DDY31_16355 [Lachnospiraceae bacterium]|nr:hypothetical protein [Lachnospiraceae bacterium]
MDKEKYLKEKLAEYQEFVVNQVNKNPEHFGDLVERSAWLMGHQPLYMNPYEYKDGFYDAVREKDWQSVNDYLYQETCYRLVPSADGGPGVDHSFYIHWAIEAYACGAEHIFQNIYPYELGLTDYGYRYCVVCSNLLIAQFYNDDKMLHYALTAADKFTKSRAGKWERTVIQFLLDILNKDFEAANVELLNVCKGYSRIDKSMYAIEDICIPAHGLYFIAKSWLIKEEFTQIKMPVHKMFLQDYAQWRLDNTSAVLKPYMVYPPKMDIINKIYAMPVAKTQLTKMRETEQSKLRTVTDGERMYQIFVEDLRKYIKRAPNGN